MSLEQYPRGCGGCKGSCCFGCGAGRPPWEPNELVDMAARFNGNTSKADEEVAGSVQLVDIPNGRCSSLNTDGECQIETDYGYKAKPRVCRADYEVGNELCLLNRTHKGLAL